MLPQRRAGPRIHTRLDGHCATLAPVDLSARYRSTAMLSRAVFIIVAGVLSADVTGPAQVGQPGASTSLGPGAFTDAQATRGARLADKHCASCHDARTGGSAPPLSGARFMD